MATKYTIEPVIEDYRHLLDSEKAILKLKGLVFDSLIDTVKTIPAGFKIERNTETEYIEIYGDDHAFVGIIKRFEVEPLSDKDELEIRVIVKQKILTGAEFIIEDIFNEMRSPISPEKIVYLKGYLNALFDQNVLDRTQGYLDEIFDFKPLAFQRH
jgi:hypothetical protein